MMFLPLALRHFSAQLTAHGGPLVSDFFRTPDEPAVEEIGRLSLGAA
jgi:hypothetical protein